MTVMRIDIKEAREADYTFITLEQIVRADFYVQAQARNEGYAMVYMSDGTTFHVEGEQALALEEALKRQSESPTFPPR